MLGASVEGPEQREFNGLSVELWPRVSWSPLFALTFADLEARPLPALPFDQNLQAVRRSL